MIKLLILFICLNTFIIASNLTKGIGVASINIPEYIGSSNSKVLVVPFPYIDYKSKTLNIKKNRLFNNLFLSNLMKIELSLSGTIPVKSDISSLRYNMEDLDPTLEIGPNFIFNLLEQNNYLLTFELPLRSIFSVNSKKIDYIGLNLTPKVVFEYEYNYLTIFLSTGPTFSNKKYNNYFYEVKSYDSTLIRPMYNSSGGYSGWKSSIGISITKNEFYYGAYVRYYNLSNAKFENSPLVDTKKAIFAGLSCAYIF